MRLVSLLPSATEIVYALGLGDDLVGVTFECEVPASYRAGTTVVVGGRDTRGMSPGDIDAYVRAQVAAGADLYTLHAGALAGLDPDLILTQDLCRVCALPSGRVADAVDHLGCRAEVLSLDPYTLDDVLEAIRASCSPVSRLNRVTVRSMMLLLPPTKMPLSPARSTTSPRTCQYEAFSASPRLAGSSLIAEKFRIGVSPG